MQLAMKGSRCDSMLGAAPAPSPCAEPAGAAADEPGAPLPPGAELEEVSVEDPDGDEGGVAPPPQAESKVRAMSRLTQRIVAPPYHACALSSSPYT